MARIVNSKSFNLEFNMENKQQLDELVNYVNNLIKMQSDTDFQSFIKNKCMEVLNQVIDSNLLGGTTNDDAINTYIDSNHIEDVEDGFIIYNDAKIPAKTVNPGAYPEEQFSIALAFEYGVGIVGEESSVSQNAWNYDVNHHGNSGWVFIKDDGTWERTRGYAGFEIYGQTATLIQNSLPEWVNEYITKEV